MAAPAHPLVHVRMPGPHGRPATWTARITAWVRRSDGWHADVTWREDAEGPELTALLPAEYIGRADGQDYRAVPRRDAESVRGGRVATGHEWRRTG